MPDRRIDFRNRCNRIDSLCDRPSHHEKIGARGDQIESVGSGGVGIEELGDNDFYGQSYFVDPEGQFVGELGDAYKPELIVRDLDLDTIRQVRDRWAFYRDRRPEAYDDIVAR